MNHLGLWGKTVEMFFLMNDIEVGDCFKDIPAQWAKIRQGLDIFRISSKCVCLSNGEV